MIKLVNCVVASSEGFVLRPYNEPIPDAITDKIISYEAGKLKPEQIIDLYRELIDLALVTQLGDKYEIMAKQLVDAGLLKTERKVS